MRVLLNTVPFYGKGEGVRTYTAGLLRGLSASDADMEWYVLLRRADFERLGLEGDPRFHLLPLASLARPAPLPGLRFLWRNAIDQALMPAAGLRVQVAHFLDSYGPLVLPGRTPLALTVHDVIPLAGGAYHSPAVRGYLAGLMRTTIPRAAAILAASETTAEQLRRLLSVPAERVIVSPMGVDERFHPATLAERERVARQYRLTVPYLLFLGTIEPRKNVARLVRAFVRARRDYHLPHQLLIAGKLGWGYDDVLAAIEEARLGEALRLLGYMPEEDVPALLSGADTLLYPSLEEGFGLPVVEGMACGTPVITSSISAVAEVAGAAALLVDPLDEGALAEALGRVYNDTALLAGRRAAGLAQASRYSWARVATRTVEVYERLAGLSRGS